ncbi:MAG: response regulator [Acidobacteriota bacterium]
MKPLQPHSQAIAVRYPPQRCKRVLVVDSDESCRLILALLLGEEGHEVTTCAESAQAFQFLQRRVFDFVITEHSRDGVDGLALLEGVKQTHLHLPVLVLAAYYEVEPYIVAMNLGALDFLRKPIDYSEIQRLIRYSH